jgi:hypothetical protein
MSPKEASEIIYLRPDLVKGQRFTQDTPVTPDVWLRYASAPGKAQELMFTPDRDSTVEQLVLALRISLARVAGAASPPVIYNQTHAMAVLTLEQLILAVLPVSVWWMRELGADPKKVLYQIPLLLKEQSQIEPLLMNPAEVRRKGSDGGAYSESLLHMVRIAGALLLGKAIPKSAADRRAYFVKLIKNLEKLFASLDLAGLWKELDRRLPAPGQAPLWRVFLNREAASAIYRSRQTVKADAAIQLFNISCDGLRWAVVDSGIDATHKAFGGNGDAAASRIERTYDFTRLKDLLYSSFEDDKAVAKTLSEAGLTPEQWSPIRQDLQSRLASGRFFEWDLLERVLRVDHAAGAYRSPENQHGTHVAGIIAADGRRPPKADAAEPVDGIPAPPEVTGICPDLQLYDLRVFDKDGAGDEFSILAALQFIRHLNANRDTVTIHGVNMSFSLKHSADSYACGATPVCEECARLAGAGIVVVAAAGNRGYRTDDVDGFGNYNDISITDPGNAEDVITVGSTHRQMPHKYGVSYFSSRGPTGDGRRKPDLLAPGEKIVSTIPGNKTAVLDGTSMAAPHVSGAAALLMARHRELIGQPRRIKEILCRTATDLERERSFQGAGLLDILRALQSV